ncbi:hypothetical protein [Sedimentibacter acidaminivorans]|jgi:hypothetical protein|nr:hypothetical protein [Sedimentibacter acidaminivorans]
MEFSKEELEKAISLLSSTITNCEKMQLKFAEGTLFIIRFFKTQQI